MSGGAKQEKRRTGGGGNHQPTQGSQRKRSYNDCCHQHGRQTSQGKTRSRACIEGILREEPRARSRQERRRGPHHDRKGRKRRHAEQADQDHARRVKPDAQRPERSEQATSHDRDEKPGSIERKPRSTRGKQLELGHTQKTDRGTESSLHAQLHRSAPKCCDSPGSCPSAANRRKDQKSQGSTVDVQHPYIKDSLEDRG